MLALLMLLRIYITFPVDELTNEILATHTLIFYLEDIDDNTYLAIPGRDFFHDRQYDISVSPGEVTLTMSDYDGGVPAGWIIGLYENLHITMVEINPDATAGKSSIEDELKKAGVDIANYHEVMKYYGLE